jgi:ribose transport system substrate-binding protein
MIHFRLRRGFTLVVALAAIAGSIAAGTGATSTANRTPASVQHATFKKGLKLAFFSVGGNNTYLLSGMAGARAAAKKYGASIQIFNGQFNGALQLNQVMGAIAQKGFDGIVLEPNNSQQLCAAVKAALKAHIAIGITNVPACTASYEKPYPGTAIFVGGQGPTAYKQWLTTGFKSNPAGGEFAVLVGPITQGNSVRTKQVLAQVNPEFPKWKEVAFEPTEYQASVALTKTQDILQSHPGLKLLFSNYSGQTPGAISAIKAAGKTSQVKIYDLGGDKQMFNYVKSGQVASTEVYLPYEEQYHAVQAVVAQLSGLKSLDGVKVGQFWDLTKDPRLHGLSPFVTKATISKYLKIGLPEY